MNSIQAGFNHKQSTTTRSNVSHAPHFAGKKETKDALTLTSKKQAATAKADHQGLSLKKLIVGGLLLGGAGTASAAVAHSHGLSARQENAGSSKFSDAVKALVPGLDNDGAMEVLKRPSFQPTDVNLFSSVLYGGQAAKPAQSNPLTDKEAKAQLERSLNKRFGNNGKDVKEALELFDNSTFKAIVPDARLRASIINLKGSVGEGAIDAYTSGKFGKVEYNYTLPQDKKAHVITKENETPPVVQLNALYQNEDINLLRSILAHEAFHDDKKISLPEERTAHVGDAFTDFETILENFEKLNSNDITLRQQEINTKVLGLLNSRTDGNVHPFTSHGNVYPGGKVSLENFGSAITVADPDSAASLLPSSPGNDVLKSVLNKVTGQSVDSPDFDENTIALLDKGQQVLSPVELVALAKALKLDVGELPTSKNDKPSSTLPTHGSVQTSGANRSHKILWF